MVENHEVEYLIKKFKIKPTLIHRDIPLFNKMDGNKLIDICDKLDIGILGIEGFVIKNSNIIPQMDYIADFSDSVEDKNFNKISIEASRKFLDSSKNHPTLLFEFVLN